MNIKDEEWLFNTLKQMDFKDLDDDGNVRVCVCCNAMNNSDIVLYCVNICTYIRTVVSNREK